ncbi:23s rrna (uracil-5-)-methyltransferase [Plasmopara halstedii]|uniref:23s rrna (Uracil-5-)-methyltransferase n=1 Tax=Plasmopara halstedii TaxID=4781 RepID=A0A0P1AWZ6_PLAHL|nr:23s rrna (uracil-5-)-methyltransferase [Plasmopara halstedii]CEG46341.1 23s rrna (uracil-5-)-methyltransferase [Plasmopara halstedii]|eukprot:XP_024582710.1 23s rrna (uracil-5-)-methyltransferase [Plasmopara halstedii]
MQISTVMESPVDGAQMEENDIKVIIMNYGKWKDAKTLTELLHQRGVSFKKVQKSRQLSFGFVHFHSKEERAEAIPKLETIEWNGELLEVKDVLVKKSMKLARQSYKRCLKEQEAPKEQQEDVSERDIRDVVTPWADVPYDAQLERKEVEMKKVLVKIVRQTRKEYGKKEKRVAKNCNVSKKRKLEDEQIKETQEKPLNVFMDNSKPQYSLKIPNWLTSNGSLYIVANDHLYTRTLEADAETTWHYVANAENIVAIVSFGSELVAVKTDNTIYALKTRLSQPDSFNWEKLCSGPEGYALSSLASLRGTLIGCTGDGKIYKQEGTGRFAAGKWTQLGEAPGVSVIGLHNGFLYAHNKDSNCAVPWWRASLDATALNALTFEPFNATMPRALGITSHNRLLILLTLNSIEYVEEDGTVQASIPMTHEVKDAMFTGFTSHNGLCCPMDSIHASPVTEGYRNKCEFSFGFDKNNKPCVGFRLGLFREGSVVVSKPDECINVSKDMKAVCAVMQVILETSGVPVYDVHTKTGVWRVLTVRQSINTEELMVIVQVNPAQKTLEERAAVKELIVKRLTDEENSFRITSIYVQEYEGLSAPSDNDSVEHVFGKTKLEEHLLGMRFSISPNAFFQVNTLGAEKLYTLVKQHANANEHTMLYDVCCGTGTIGICLSQGVGEIVGIETCKPATDDAEVNAELNNVKNVSFVNSKAEMVMKNLLQQKRGENKQQLDRVVAIVDPPRAGLHHQVLRALRACAPVERIVYVSCNPTNSLIRDAVTLCGPNTKSIQGQAFKPVYAVPVDMFPHTPHCEMIIVFDRVEAEN